MIEQFYKDIFPNPDDFKMLWQLQGKRSHWFKDLGEMLAFMEKNPENIFHGLGTCLQKPAKDAWKRRLTLDTVGAITALHLDIDVKDPIAHKKNENLPENIDEARPIAHKFLEPTYLVDSGHGLHAYYILDKPYIIDTEEARAYIISLLQQFQEAHRRAFPEYDIDYTFDITRILRCPGTINAKDPDNPKTCEITEVTGTKYWTEEIEDAIDFDEDRVGDQSAPTDSSSAGGGRDTYVISGGQKIPDTKGWTTRQFKKWFDDQGLVIDHHAKLDSDTWLELDSADPRFSKAFHHKIEKLDKDGKPTGSYKVDINAYDLDLANIASRQNLPDQQIVDLLVWHRQHHGVNIEKICHKRRDYFARTLIKAGVHKELKQIETKRAQGQKMDKQDKASLLRFLSDKLECQILRVIRFTKDPNPLFELELADLPGKTIKLGSFESGIMNQRTFRAKIGATGVKMPKVLKSKEWDDQIVPAIQVVMEEGKTPTTATYEGQIESWFGEYFSNTDIFDSFDDYLETGPEGQPFMQDGSVFFKLEIILEWIKTTFSHTTDFTFVTTMISNGFTQEKVYHPKKEVYVYLWAAPAGFYTKPKQNQNNLKSVA